MAIRSVFAVIDENGISAPTYDEIVEYYKTEYRKIYGEDSDWVKEEILKSFHEKRIEEVDLR